MFLNKINGFSLVEVLIAVVIIAVGVLGWTKTQISSVKNRTVSNEITIASEYAMEKLEQLSLEFSSGNIPSDGQENATIKSIVYVNSWSITKDANEIVGNSAYGKEYFYTMNVRVEWVHYGNRVVEYQRLVLRD